MTRGRRAGRHGREPSDWDTLNDLFTPGIPCRWRLPRWSTDRRLSAIPVQPGRRCDVGSSRPRLPASRASPVKERTDHGRSQEPTRTHRPPPHAAQDRPRRQRRRPPRTSRTAPPLTDRDAEPRAGSDRGGPRRRPRPTGDRATADAAPKPAAAASRPPAPAPATPGEDGYGFDEEINNRYEEIKRGSTHISELQQMTMPQLLKIAKDEGLTDYTGLKKQDLIFKILKERVKQNGLMFGEGTLEVLPDGFGFLRSPDYNYLPCPDDIYISPTQIRRFGLRTGAVVAGQIRPPKENERYFALLRVEAINYNDPDILTQKVVFDDLTPLHPNKRLHPGDRPDRDQHARHGPGDADRQGPARPDRRPAAHRQDHPAAEDRQQRPAQPSRVLRHRAADRRAARGSDRDGADRQGRRTPRWSARPSTSRPAGTCRSARW